MNSSLGNISRLTFNSVDEWEIFSRDNSKMLDKIWFWHETLGNKEEGALNSQAFAKYVISTLLFLQIQFMPLEKMTILVLNTRLIGGHQHNVDASFQI